MKNKTPRKLSLHRETLKTLTGTQLGAIAGAASTGPYGCPTAACTYSGCHGTMCNCDTTSRYTLEW